MISTRERSASFPVIYAMFVVRGEHESGSWGRVMDHPCRGTNCGPNLNLTASSKLGFRMFGWRYERFMERRGTGLEMKIYGLLRVVDRDLPSPQVGLFGSSGVMPQYPIHMLET